MSAPVMGGLQPHPGRHRARRAAMAAVAAVVLLLAVAASASAYVLEGSRWPGKTITYYPMAYKKAVDAGAKTWNNAHVGVKLKRVSSKSKANFLVTYNPNVRACEGLTLVGWQGQGVQSAMYLGRGCDRTFMIITATHELGHILGLGHERHKCARMNSSADYPSGTPGHCRYHPESYWLKHLLKGDDVAGARALYGG